MDGSHYKGRNGNATLTVLLLLGIIVSYITYYVVCFAVLKHNSVSSAQYVTKDRIITATAEAIVRKLVNHCIYEKNLDLFCVLPSHYNCNAFDSIKLQTHDTGLNVRCVITFISGNASATRTYQIKKRAHNTIIVPIRMS